jgi:hypothetical protein
VLRSLAPAFSVLFLLLVFNTIAAVLGLSLLGGQLADTDLESIRGRAYCGSRFNLLLEEGGLAVQGVTLEVAPTGADVLLQPSVGFTFLATVAGPPVWADLNNSAPPPRVISAVPHTSFDDILQSFLTVLQVSLTSNVEAFSRPQSDHLTLISPATSSHRKRDPLATHLCAPSRAKEVNLAKCSPVGV